MFIAVGVMFAWGSTYYSMGGSARPGPGYFPFGLAVLMAILGSIVLFKSLTLEVEGGDPIGAWAWKPLLVINGAVFIFGWALPHLGMFTALPLLVIGSAMAGSEFRLRDAIINSIVLTAGSWVIFIWGLKLTIPLWPSFLAS
jgi:hypothetical protein